MDAFASGFAASLVAGAVLWIATHQKELVSVRAARRRRLQIAGAWHSYHLSRDSTASRRPMWVRHDQEISVSAFGTLRGVSRATYGRRMRYTISGHVRGADLRVYLDNQDAHESQATFVYPNLLGGGPLLGVMVGEDFDGQWFVSPCVMTRELLPETSLLGLAKQVRVNRPSLA